MLIELQVQPYGQAPEERHGQIHIRKCLTDQLRCGFWEAIGSFLPCLAKQVENAAGHFILSLDRFQVGLKAPAGHGKA
jgi:hypothetical protein